ncbi:MAG TPA: hypothetical protein VE685_07345 [Thermoanaerobaculia bacterium]|nr:hypothetical protein [Thermoanaerobaculia bacterium]
MRDDELVRRFLLGELKEDDAERVEARLLEEDELFDLCEAVEADLLEAVARGELAPAERDRVLKRLASSPQGRARLALARGLAAFADGKLSSGPLPAPLPFRRRGALTARPVVRRAALAAGLLALLAGIWAVFHETIAPGDGETRIVEQPAPEPPSHRNPTADLRPRPAPPVIAPVPEPTPPPQDQDVEERELEVPTRVASKPEVFSLSLLTLRSGGEPEEIQIPSGKEHIQFHVNVTITDFDSYDAVVSRGDEKIFSKSRLKPTSIDDELVLILDLPASALPAGKYEMKVYGNSAEGTPELLLERELEVSGGG